MILQVVSITTALQIASIRFHEGMVKILGGHPLLINDSNCCSCSHELLLPEAGTSLQEELACIANSTFLF